ncbi:LicD family protein [Thermoanaerobacterium sp. R66]|uniref:LicD family protein n=1 Tax=Thermoanaerobacterium sp. R66 TaxID=2742479 RepID=UPI002380498E|nr:LicD family protein [Thermoanaerobacterium sp. R66]MDE4541321.1 LicD family protein [Thermoanaerobacterium sp. R66]
MQEINLSELRKIQIDILNVVTEFCDNHGIKYFLCGGTLIGAVRHQGYIPWDDDIDIALLRNDYEYFINNFNRYNTLYKVYEPNNTDWYPYPFAKVSYENSIIDEDTDNMPYNIGINIDVFPIDNLPDSKNKQKKLLEKILLQRNILMLKLIKINKERVFYKNIILYLGKFIFKYKKTNTIAKNITELATTYINYETNKAGVIVWGYGESEIVDKSIFNETIKMKFEDKEYSVPRGYHQWLTSIYGNYMDLPPVEKQVTHHVFRAYIK